MSEAFAQGMPSAIAFRRIVRGRRERPQIEFGREGNVQVYPWQAGRERRFRDYRCWWRRLARAHGCFGLGRGFGDRLAARDGLSPPAVAKRVAFKNRVELLRQPIRPLKTSRESRKSIQSSGHAVPFEQLTRRDQPVLLPQRQRMQKMVGVGLMVALRQALQKDHGSIRALIEQCRRGGGHKTTASPG
jgi:hypothetical protein